MNILTKEGYPNYDHPDFSRDNPCHDLFMDCEGDCDNCPNKDFFACAGEKLKSLLKEKND